MRDENCFYALPGAEPLRLTFDMLAVAEPPADIWDRQAERLEQLLLDHLPYELIYRLAQRLARRTK